MGPGEDPGPRRSCPPSPVQPPGSRRGSGPALGLSPPGSLQALPPHLSGGLLPPTQVSLRALREAEGGALTTALKLQGQKREAVHSENPRIPVGQMGKLRHEGHPPPSTPEARTGAQGEAADSAGAARFRAAWPAVTGAPPNAVPSPSCNCSSLLDKGSCILLWAPQILEVAGPSRADGGLELSVPAPSPQGR